MSTVSRGSRVISSSSLRAPAISLPIRRVLRSAGIRNTQHKVLQSRLQSTYAGEAPIPKNDTQTHNVLSYDTGTVASSSKAGASSKELENETSPITRYHELVSAGTLRKDDHQQRIVGKLQRLHEQLRTYIPPPIPQQSSNNSLFSKLFGKTTPDVSIPENHPKGLYLFGDVGTGKSMLMDLFYATLPPNVKKKSRVHYHAFMIDVHKRIHEYKRRHPYDHNDPILPVSRDLAREASVICLDEFQVTDILDAMILRRLLECLLQFGVTFVMTSNRHPNELYKNGIQRASFIPAIELIMQQFDVVDLDSGTDYRRIPRALSHVYYHPLNPENRGELEKLFKSLVAADGPNSEIVYDKTLTIWGRKLPVPQSSQNVAWFTFNALCGQPLSAADYLEITRTFKTVFVADIPQMTLGQKDLARRFITFIDACYESKTKLFASSEVPIYQVFSDDVSNKASHANDHVRSVMDDLGLSDQVIGHTSIFSGEEEIFAFARACSRLIQMGTKEWAETAGQ